MDIKEALCKVSDCLKETEEETISFIVKYTNYSFLWDDDIQEKFEEFLNDKDKYDNANKFGEDVENEEEDDNTSNHPILKGITDKMPALIHFEENITRLKMIKTEIDEVKTPYDINFLRVNVQPLKKSLETLLTLWIEQ